MIKVLYVISDRNVGGAGVLLCNLLRHIDRETFWCAVALPFGSDLRERLLPLGVTVRELENSCDTANGASVRELISVVRELDVQIIHANAALCARIAGRLCGRVVIHTRHCYYPIRERGLFTTLTENFANRLLSDLVIATSQTAAENLKELGIPKKKIRIILNGSDPVREVEDWEIQALREKWGLTTEDYCVGICARLEGCKGHSVFLRAAEIVKERPLPRRIRFLIVGEGSLRKNLEQNIRVLGLSDIVKMVGFVADMAPVYRLLRIHVNCSCGTETSCLAISEGMSAGLPTVASDYGGNPAMIGNSGAGIITPMGNAMALADAICKIASDQVTEDRMSLAARQRYVSRFTAQRMTEQTEDVYRCALIKKQK